MKYNKVGCVVINFLRPEATITCVDTLLQQCPDIEIYLGDQDQNSSLATHYNLPNIHYYQLPYDCGISYSRNKLITQALNDGCDYFMWIDNDFIFDNQLNLDHPIKILETNRRIGVVGGAMRKDGVTCHYERFMYYDRRRGVLVYVPIELTYPEAKEIDGIQFYDCDITFNFAIAKKEVWANERVRWNEKIKVKFEHSTWFLLFQKYSNFQVAYCPSFTAIHAHVGSAKYQVFRMRESDEYEFAKFFNLKCMFEIGGTARDFYLKQQTKHTSKKLHINDPQNIPIPLPEPIKNIQPNVDYIDLQILNENGIIPILLEKSCKEIINKKILSSNYVLGFHNHDELIKGKELTNNKHIYQLYPNITKMFLLDNIKIEVPLPVVAYLLNLYGENWNKT